MSPHSAPQSPPSCLIPEYFAGREVFITGATGFMGKVLVERLLWTCPEISHLHLLVRSKKDLEPNVRLTQLQQSQVFDVIREKCPERLNKLSIVAGDITEHNFGIDQESLTKLNQVSVVFHLAATVKFNELLTVTVKQNVRSVLTLMNICDELPLMQVLVYLSTTYSNGELASVEERVYPAPRQLSHLLTLVETLPEDVLAALTPRLISPKLNMYTFTKAMAESALAGRARDVSYAIAIFRPSIVTSSLRHPFPGWIENLNGPCGLAMGVGKGLLHVALCDGHKRSDMIPVDIATDTLIAAAWETGIENSSEARVYNCSSYDNPITWDQFRVQGLRGIRHYPFDAPLWYSFLIYTKSPLVMAVAERVLHTAPLLTVDFLYDILGVRQRLKLSTICQRMRNNQEALKCFMTREWKFSTDNVKRLRGRLAAADAALYNVDPHSIDWGAHCVDFVKGMRKYLLRESDQDLDKAHARVRLLYVIHRATQYLMAYIVCRTAVRSAPVILTTIATLITFIKNTRKINT